MISVSRLRTISFTDRLQTPTAAILIVIIGTTGCVSTPPPQSNFISSSVIDDADPSELTPWLAKVRTAARNDLVLLQMHLGAAAFDSGHLNIAESSLDQVISGIEAVYANDVTAQKARSIWNQEGMKDFKGEPYERAMAYYYRGLLYLLKGDFENARASFKSGALQDAFAEEEQYRCDFALLVLLEGWTSQMLGDHQLATAAYEEVKRLRPDITLPNQNDNVLVLIESGYAPRKVADGLGHSELKYRRGKGFDEQKAFVVTKSEQLNAYPLEDLYFQASTRGGRQVEKILNGHVVFRKTQENIGGVLTSAANGAMHVAQSVQPVMKAGTLMGASAALGLIGAVQMAVAANINPRADVRTWGNLPDAVHVVTYHSDNLDEENLSVRFKSTSGEERSELAKTIKVSALANGSGFGWARSRHAYELVQKSQ